MSGGWWMAAGNGRRPRRGPVHIDPTIQLAADYSEQADAYRRLWSPVLEPMAAPLLDRLPLAAARRVLDVGAGTGASLPRMAARAPLATVVGVDRAFGMLRIARQGGSHPLAAMDARALAFASAAFDVATLIFMLFHVPEPEAALRDVHRVLRRGGAAGVATWAPDDGMPGMAVWSEELDSAGAPPDPRDPIVMQRERMDTPDKLAALVRDAGFAGIHTWTQSFEHRWTVESVMQVQLGCGVTARRIGNLAPDAAAACRGRVRRRLMALAPEAFIYRPAIVFATMTADHV